MKNPLEFLKHIVKDPINTTAEADTRKKEIMPLLYGSICVMAISIILQTVAKLDFMSIFSFIGLVGVGFCGFLFMVINKAKAKFGALTCGRCNTLAEIKTSEDFAKYVSYVVEKDEAKFHGYTGNTKPTNGVYSQVKYSGSASAVLSVTLTCPHCGEIKHLRFSAEPFKCHAEATRVGALQLAGVRDSLEAAVKTAVSDYNTPDKKNSIPYTFHSSKNPNFENRYKLKGANSAGAHPDYMGAKIDYHKDVEEILEHYFIFNELTGTLIDPDATSKKNTKTKNVVSSNLQNNSITKPKQTSPSNLGVPQMDKTHTYEPEATKNKDTAPSVASTYKTLPKELLEAVPETKEEQKSKHKKIAVIIVGICMVLIVGGIVGTNLANRDKAENGDATDTLIESSQSNENESITNAIEKININDYVGYWHIKENQEKELTIHSGSSDSLNFSLLYSKKDKINNVSAQLNDNIATFSLATEGGVVKGLLTFQKGEITVSITQSSLEAIPVEELKFTEQHISSLIPKEEEQTYTSSATEDVILVPTSSNASEEAPKPSLKETPYLLSVEENAYEIYEAPSYNSTYVQMLPKGTFTIVAEEYDENNNLWGKLKSGIGWICIAENTVK